MYTLKLFTEKSFQLFNTVLEELVKSRLSNTTEERRASLKSFYKSETKTLLQYSIRKKTELTEKLGLDNLTFEEVSLPKQETGYQSQPRVMWEGEVTKIDDIDRCISFTTRN